MRLKLSFTLLAILALSMVAATLASAAPFSPWGPAVNAESVPGTDSDLNTAFLEGCPGLSPDGLSLFFVSNRPGGQGSADIWIAARSSPTAPWGEPTNPGAPLNSESAEICPTPLHGGHLLFVSDRPGTCGGPDLYRSRLHSTKAWLEPENLGCQLNSSGADFSPSFVEQENGTFIYFSSDRPGGLGGQDIYASRLRADGSFGAAVAVDGVNTASDDARPNLRKDGLEMFFDSTRPGGQGGPDIWSTSRESVHESWSEPVNVGPEVNSSAGDVRASLSWDGRTLFFGSSRLGGEGNQDLYFTTRTKP